MKLQNLILILFTYDHRCVISDFPVSLTVWISHMKRLSIGHSSTHSCYNCQQMAPLATHDEVLCNADVTGDTCG